MKECDNAHIFNSKDFAKTSKFDLFYFVEDDYIHSENSLKEMIYSYEKFSTICEKDVILCKPLSTKFKFVNI